MTEVELIKILIVNLPTIAVAIGVARIYYKVTTFLTAIEKQILTNKDDIKILYELHLNRHPEDYKIIVEERSRD